MLVIDIIMLLISIALAVIGSIAVVNALTLPRLGRGIDGGGRYSPSQGELISMLIPLRNESLHASRLVQVLLMQDDLNFEVLLLDDESTDDTVEHALKATKGDPRVRVLAGKPLPDGWVGKNWACAQLAAEARGDVLVFTDADVYWAPDALHKVRRALENTDVDCYSICPTQGSFSWAERLVVPLMALNLAYLPISAVNHLPWPTFATASGQCMIFKRAAYEKVGGHEAVKNHVVEGGVLAKRVKHLGLKLRLVDGAGNISSRTYRGWEDVRDGFAKNILYGYGSPWKLLILTLFHWLVFMVPWLWLFIGWIGGSTLKYPIWALALTGTGLAVRALTAKATRQRVGDAFLLPVSVFLLTLIAGRALRWHWFGGGSWKGRAF